MWLSVHCLHIKHQQRWPVTKTGEQTHTFEHVIRILCNVGSPRRYALHLCGWDLSFVTKSKSAPWEVNLQSISLVTVMAWAWPFFLKIEQTHPFQLLLLCLHKPHLPVVKFAHQCFASAPTGFLISFPDSLPSISHRALCPADHRLQTKCTFKSSHWNLGTSEGSLGMPIRWQ